MGFRGDAGGAREGDAPVTPNRGPAFWPTAATRADVRGGPPSPPSLSALPEADPHPAGCHKPFSSAASVAGSSGQDFPVRRQREVLLLDEADKPPRSRDSDRVACASIPEEHKGRLRRLTHGRKGRRGTAVNQGFPLDANPHHHRLLQNVGLEGDLTSARRASGRAGRRKRGAGGGQNVEKKGRAAMICFVGQAGQDGGAKATKTVAAQFFFFFLFF